MPPTGSRGVAQDSMRYTGYCLYFSQMEHFCLAPTLLAPEPGRRKPSDDEDLVSLDGDLHSSKSRHFSLSTTLPAVSLVID